MNTLFSDANGKASWERFLFFMQKDAASQQALSLIFGRIGLPYPKA